MTELQDPVALDSLDPASTDPGFWLRFHSRVMGDAQEELARRRMTGEPGVVDLVFAWRRALVPMALLAAAMAGIMTVSRTSEPPVQVVALEEVLTEDLNLLNWTDVQAGEGGLQGSLFAGIEEGF